MDVLVPQRLRVYGVAVLVAQVAFYGVQSLHGYGTRLRQRGEQQHLLVGGQQTDSGYVAYVGRDHRISGAPFGARRALLGGRPSDGGVVDSIGI